MISEVELRFQKVLEEAERNKQDEELADLDSPKNAIKKEETIIQHKEEQQEKSE